MGGLDYLNPWVIFIFYSNFDTFCVRLRVSMISQAILMFVNSINFVYHYNISLDTVSRRIKSLNQINSKSFKFSLKFALYDFSIYLWKTQTLWRPVPILNSRPSMMMKQIFLKENKETELLYPKERHL